MRFKHIIEIVIARVLPKQSRKIFLMLTFHTVAAFSANPHLGQYDADIAAIEKNSRQIIQNYLSDNQPKENSQLFVLISFSMPDILIKQYIDQAKKYRAHVVVTGLIDNDFMQTQMKIKELGGMLIDPNLFTRYKVEAVPALILTSDKESGKYDIMLGAVSIEHALESFKASGDLKESAANRLAGKS